MCIRLKAFHFIYAYLLVYVGIPYLTSQYIAFPDIHCNSIKRTFTVDIQVEVFKSHIYIHAYNVRYNFLNIQHI